MKLILTLNPEQENAEGISLFGKREAARAVIIDENKKVALLNVAAKGYYKLPGGGIEEGEDKISALHRECLEETGCEIELLAELGSIVEYRKMHNLLQTSYCFLVKVKGEKQKTSFTHEECCN